MNENVRWFTVEDWMGNELGRYESIDEAEELVEHLVETDTDFQYAETEEEKEEISIGLREDLYITGWNNEGKKVAVEF